MPSSIGDTFTYLEGRVASVEVFCGILAKRFGYPELERDFLVDMIAKAKNHVNDESEPGFKQGFNAGLDKVLEAYDKTHVSVT